jgi:hypothetical protein
MGSKEPIEKDNLTVYLKPELVNYGLSVSEALRELDARISNIKGKNQRQTNLFKTQRVMYGLQLIGFPGQGVLKMAQLHATSVYRSYLTAELSKRSRVYVEVVETGFYIFMVCDLTAQNFDDMVSLI